MRTFRHYVGAALAAVAVLGAASPAAAASAPSGQISDVKSTAGTLQFVFSAKNLPDGDVLDPRSVVVSANDSPLSATASAPDGSVASSGPLPARQVILTLDTSGSMQGDGITAARAAALAYAHRLPDDVRVGLVTFADKPHLVLAPTTSRSALDAAIGGVRAEGNTALYDGILAAASAFPKQGNGAVRRLLILSDGDDTSSTHTADQAIAGLTASGISADVVAFRLPGKPAVLSRIATNSHGQVLPAASAADLAGAFAVAAAAFEQQVLVTVQVPDELAGTRQHLLVSLNSGSQSVTAEADVQMPAGAAPVEGLGPQISSAAAASTSPVGMWLVLGVAFLGLLAVGMLLLWVPVSAGAQSSRQARLAEVGRYRLVGAVGRAEAAAPAQSTESNLTKATLSFVDKAVRSRGKRQGLVDELERAGLRIRPEEWAVFQVAAIIVAAALLSVVSDSILGVFVGALMGWAGCRIFIRIKISRRAHAFGEQLPDVLQLVAGSLRSGFSLNQAVAAVVREGNEPMASEIARALTEVRLGSELEDALDRVSDRMQCADLHWVVLAVRISREVGGNLAEVLMNTVGTMRERAQVRRQIRVLSAEGRISARILIALPFLLATYFALFNPRYLRPLYTTGLGIALIVLGALLLGVGSFWLSRLVKIEV